MGEKLNQNPWSLVCLLLQPSAIVPIAKGPNGSAFHFRTKIGFWVFSLSPPRRNSEVQKKIFDTEKKSDKKTENAWDPTKHQTQED